MMLLRTPLANGGAFYQDGEREWFTAPGQEWVGEDTLHTMRTLAGGGRLYTIVEGPRRGERAIEHANGKLTMLPPRILWGAARRSGWLT